MAGRKKGTEPQGGHRAHGHSHGVKRTETHGAKSIETLARISQKKQTEEIRRSLELGLEAADSVVDRNISLFSRGHQPAFAGINTFMKAPYCEDIRKVGDYEAAFVGAPFDSATTYRPGTRFGPQAVRRISALYDGYWFDGGVDIFEELDLCDAGDIFVIPGNIEKTFDQVTKAVSHIYTSGAFPIIWSSISDRLEVPRSPAAMAAMGGLTEMSHRSWSRKRPFTRCRDCCDSSG